MDLQAILEQRAKVEAFQRKHRVGLLTLLFTDLVGSTKLKQDLGDKPAVNLIQRHHALVRDILRGFTEGEEIDTAGDSFFIVFAKPSDAVRFALTVQAKLRDLASACEQPLQDRIGLHIGEVMIEERAEGPKPKDLYGLQVDICARVMSLAEGNQILLTRSAFDNARQVLKGEEIPGVQNLSWLNHGPYILKGVEEPLEICEVGESGQAVLQAPADSEKVHRYISPDAEPVLGWRPALGPAVPGTSWVLEEKLGEGGFGEVWLGRHATTKERRVFKFCFRADRVRALKREVTLFRLLKERVGEHPNVVRLLEVFFEEPPFYLEMEYVEGRDLKTWGEARGRDGMLPSQMSGTATRGPSPKEGSWANQIPLETRLEIVAQVAEALQAAHDAGVIHRDVKPSNILIAERGARNAESENHKSEFINHKLTAKLTDFGIGQVVSEEALAGLTKLGFTQTMMSQGSSAQTGTQMYMAPELIAGQPASTRSDIYALGVVLYQLIVGDFSKPVTTDWAQEITDPLLREDLQQCFAGRASERFAGAGQLAQRLRALPQRRREREEQAALLTAKERAAYRRGIMQTIAVAAVVVAAFVGLALYAAWKGVVARRAEATTQAVNDFLQNDLLGQASPESQPDRNLKLRTVLDRASQRIEGRFTNQPLVEASIRNTIVRTYLTLGEARAAESHAQRSIELYRSQLGPEHPDTLMSIENLARDYEAQARLAEARTLQARVLEIRKRVLGPKHPDTLRSLNYQAYVYEAQGKMAEARALQAQVLEIRKRVLGAEHPDTLRSLDYQVFVLHTQGKLNEATSLSAQLLEIRKRVLGAEHPDTLGSMKSLAFIYDTQGKFREAATLQTQVLEIEKRVLGPEHPVTLISMENLAFFYRGQGKRAEAATLDAQVLENRKRVLGPEHTDTLRSMNNLAVAYQALGKLAEAATLTAQSLDIQKRVLGTGHPGTLASMNSLASILATATNAAVRNGAEALKLATDACAKNGWKEAGFVDTLAAAHAELEQWDQAIAMEQKAISLQAASGNKDSSLLKGFEGRLRLYERHEKFRQ